MQPFIRVLIYNFVILLVMLVGIVWLFPEGMILWQNDVFFKIIIINLVWLYVREFELYSIIIFDKDICSFGVDHFRKCFNSLWFFIAIYFSILSVLWIISFRTAKFSSWPRHFLLYINCLVIRHIKFATWDFCSTIWFKIIFVWFKITFTPSNFCFIYLIIPIS